MRLLINGQEATNGSGIGDIFANDLDVKKYLKDNNKQIINYSELDNVISSPREENPSPQSPNSPSRNEQLTVQKPFTTKLYEFYQTPTFWTIAIIVGIMDLICLYFYFFEREKLKEKLKQNTLLKIFTYLLALASVIILIIPIFFLLASLGGGQRTCNRCHRKSGNCCC
ncbi:MAG: hypothetical protein GBAus27B_000348 [Mycoplasmataceae bacterium]|nr:MAG: hypothetical protein GBAus27B_000348 [Mycoplasmataceae bacterium]